MEHNEMIEKLHSQANISLEDAEDALKRANWDMLDALRLLENEGKIPPLTSSMTTTDSQENGYERVSRSSDNKTDGNFWYRAGERLREIFLWTVGHSFIIRRRDKVILNLPVIIMLVILCCMFEISIIALIAGLFFDCSYSVEINGDNNDE